MREIKFRGRDLGGNFRYGFYAVTGGCSYIIENQTWHEIETDSVAQLVGYDKDGREVYETDTLIDELENEYEATIYMRPDELRRLTLVKAA